MKGLLNRLNKIIFMTLVVGLTACNKKDRLASSTYDFSIAPPAATVLKNQTLTLTARGASKQGSVDVLPTWTISPETPATLSSSIGNSVDFSAPSLGDFIITANYNGRETTTRVAVVAFIPSAQTFDVYDDDLPAEAGILSNIFVSTNPGVELTLAELDTGYTPEGLEYLRALSAPEGSFWGVTLDSGIPPTAGLSKDLSAYNAGYLKFAIRLTRAFNDATETIQINLNDSSRLDTNPVVFNLVSGQNGFSQLTQDWQEVTIPISTYIGLGLNTTLVDVPFSIAMNDLDSSLTFDIDAVRWDTQP
jgi:hypothetical protein